MLNSPNEPLPGQQIRSADIAAIIRYGRQTTLRSGPGRLVRSGSGGQTVGSPRKYFPAPLYPPAVAVTPQPFQVIKFAPIGGDTTGDSGYEATIQPGEVNFYLSPLVSGTPMWQLVGTPPNVNFPTLTVNKGDEIYLQATGVAGAISTLNVYSSQPSDITPEDDNTTNYIFATCASTTGALTQIATGNRTLDSYAAYFIAGSTTRLIKWKWN